MERELAAFDPTVIYAPSQLDFHSDHRRVAQAVAATVSARPVLVRVYPIQVPLTPLVSNLIHDVSDLAVEMVRIRRAHTTQAESIERTARTRGYAARFFGAPSQVESFCQLSGATYGRLNRDLSGRFRGLRIRAWTDPLAAVRGTSERLRWLRAAPRS
jgi:LmbE family N-acetylglucosaminyl deacetylase